MKCAKCGKNIKERRSRSCSAFPPSVCSYCCGSNRGIHHCDLSCPFISLPEPEQSPISTAFIGRRGGDRIEATSETFLPKLYDYFSCNVSKIKFYFIDLNTIKMKIDLRLDGPLDAKDRVFQLEDWKRLTIRQKLEDSGLPTSHQVAPLFVLFLPEFARVKQDKVTVQIEGKILDPVIVDQTPDLIVLPNSYPPLTNKDRVHTYSFIQGKASVIYTQLETNKDYSIGVELELFNFFYNDFGFLFPYRNYSIEAIEWESATPFTIPDIMYQLITPTESDKFPEKQEYNWLRLGTGLGRPIVEPANPFRKRPIEGKRGAVTEVSKKLQIASNKFETICFTLPVIFPSKIYCNVTTTDSPLPVRIYDQLRKVDGYQDFLIGFDICNFSDSDAELELSSEISGITDREISNVRVPAYGKDKKARLVVYQCPKPKWDHIEKIYKPVTATLSWEINRRFEGKRELVERGSKEVKLLPHDFIVWDTEDLRSSGRFDLSSMIVAWIAPTDEKGLLDKIRGGAAKYHPQNMLEGATLDIEKDTLQVKALYDFINSETNIKYVNQPFVFSGGVSGQRVILPERVIEAECGNCIDLTVLFASLMEGLGINPLIMLTKNHAFLGWGSRSEKDEMQFLECTVLGSTNPVSRERYTFEESQSIALRKFKDEFFLIGSEELFPNDLLKISKGSRIISLEEARSSGIHKAP